MKSYVARNSLRLLSLYLLALAAVTLIPNLIISAIPIKQVAGEMLTDYRLVGAIALVLFLYLMLKGKLERFWGRYKNTVGAQTPRFSYHDYAIWLLLFFILLLIFKRSLSFRAFAGVAVGLGVCSLLLTLIKDDSSSKEEAKDTSWFSDEPINNESNDLLGRLPFVQRLYEQIKSLPFEDSFVFGLYASLGEGKTSVINLLKRKFEGDGTHLIVDYDPWNFKDEKAMLIGFYDEVQKTISKSLILPGFKRTLVKYQKLLSPEFSPPGIKIVFNIDESLEEIRQRIEDYITSTRKKLLIIVDDVDRLEPAEILSIFKLVRLNAKFKNTIFILSFDYERVKGKLGSVTGIDEEYIEKFVQKDVTLPAADYQSNENFLDSHLEKLFAEIGSPEEDKKAFEREFSYVYQTHIRKIFKNLRRTKIYLNSLRASLAPIHKEVNLFDFILLELLKVFYRDVYRDIWHYPELYINLGWSDDRFMQSPFLFDRDENAKYQRIKEHVENLIKDKPDRDIILKILESIFPVYVKEAFATYRSGAGLTTAQNYRIQRRITHPESFIKYFMLEVPALDVPHEEVYRKLEQWSKLGDSERENSITESFFAYQRQKKLTAFLKKLNVFNEKIPSELLIAIIRAIYKNIHKFSKEYGGLEYFYRSEWDKALSLMFTLINDRLERKDISAVLEEAALNTPHVPFAVLIVHYSAREQDQDLYNIYNAINISELRAKVSERLKGHFVDSGVNIFDEYPNPDDWKFIIYRWGTNWITGPANLKVVNDYLIALSEENSRNLINVLTHTFDFRDTHELKAFYDVERIKGIVEKHVRENKLSDDERPVAEKFLAAHTSAAAPEPELPNASDSVGSHEEEIK